MSLFSKILDKLGLRKEQPAATRTTASAPRRPAAAAPNAKPVSTTAKPGASTQTVGTSTRTTGIGAPKAISEVDVVKQLEQKAKGTGLNWKQSIADLLFLLDIDNSRAARTELAKELGCPEEFMSDSAKMNTWLHKTVLRKIAENGGNIPQELLD